MNCKYIYKKGKNQGELCGKDVVFNNLCRIHIYPLCVKWRQNNVNPFDVNVNSKKLAEICSPKRKVKSPNKRISKSPKASKAKSPSKSSKVRYPKAGLGITREQCKEFKKKNNINPITKRAITRTGAVYKKITNQCEQYNITSNELIQKDNDNPLIALDLSKNSIQTSLDILKDLCKKWFMNRNVDSETNRKIVPSDYRYKELHEKCSTITDNNVTSLQEIGDNIPLIDNNNYVFIGRKKIPIKQQMGTWLLSKKLGSGGFGTVFECYDKNNIKAGSKAMKVEHELSPNLQHEIDVYKSLKNNKYIPIVYDTGVVNQLRYLVIEKLYVIDIFSYDDIPKIIKAIESFALAGRSHGDIKFDNIMTRLDGSIVLVDFGLSWEFTKDLCAKHKSGTLAFMSINTHNGYVYYKNDLESLCYAILNKINKVPWRCKKQNEIKKLKLKFNNNIMVDDKIIKKKYKLDQFKQLNNLLGAVLPMTSFEVPDYKKLIKIFENKNSSTNKVILSSIK